MNSRSNFKYIFISICALLFIILCLRENGIIQTVFFLQSPVEEELFFPAVNVHVEEYDKIVALTFDDGPSVYTEKILDFLHKKGAVATFFVLGSRLEGNEDVLIDMVKNGCEIGNHSFNHKQFTYLTDDEVAEQLQYVDDFVRNVTGFSVNAVRTPYGEYNEHLKQLINRPIVLWNVDSEDWKLKDSEKIAQNILDNVKNGSVILLHDIFEFSYEATVIVVEELLNQGYKFVTVSQMFNLNDTKISGNLFR